MKNDGTSPLRTITRCAVVSVVTIVGLLVQMNGSPSMAVAQTANIKATPPEITTVVSPKITSYCKIQVYISNHPTVSGVYRVDAAGNITLPLDTGENRVISVCDLTAREAGLVIDKFVRDELKNPWVTVTLLETRDQATFYILGKVAHPGKYRFDKNVHLSDVLKLAGGLLPEVQHVQGSLSHDGKLYPLATSPLRVARAGTNIGDNPVIEPDDVIFIRDSSRTGKGH